MVVAEKGMCPVVGLLYKRLNVEVFVEIILFIVSCILTFLYFTTNTLSSDFSIDALLVALWALVFALLISIFQTQNAIRQERLRRFFISDEWAYNHEIGYAPIEKVAPDGDSFEFVMFLGDSLARMSYGFKTAKEPKDFKPLYMISSTKFKFHKIDHVRPLHDKGVVIDRWKGTLQRIGLSESGEHVYIDIGTYTNAKELAILLDENDILDSSNVGEGILL